MRLVTNSCAVGQLCTNVPAFRNKQTVQVSAVGKIATSPSVSHVDTLQLGRDSFFFLTDVSVNTSFSDTQSKAAKIIKRSNEFRNRNQLRKIQQCCQRRVVEAFKWYGRGTYTWLKEINRDNKKVREEWNLYRILSSKEIMWPWYLTTNERTGHTASCLFSYLWYIRPRYVSINISDRHTCLSVYQTETRVYQYVWPRHVSINISDRDTCLSIYQTETSVHQYIRPIHVSINVRPRHVSINISDRDTCLSMYQTETRVYQYIRPIHVSINISDRYTYLSIYQTETRVYQYIRPRHVSINISDQDTCLSIYQTETRVYQQNGGNESLAFFRFLNSQIA